MFNKVYKFRAYSKEEGLMLYDVYPSRPGYFLLRDLNVSDKLVYNEFKGTVMQYIEENDKEGTELYSGDIVLIPAGYGGDNNYDVCLGVIDIDADYAVSKNLSDYMYDELFVAGNIFEDPDLLDSVDFGTFNTYKDSLLKDMGKQCIK